MSKRPPIEIDVTVGYSALVTDRIFSSCTRKVFEATDNLIQQNAVLGGDKRGYVFQGHKVSFVEIPVTDYLPDISDALLTKAEALFLRSQNLQTMRSKVEQALRSIFARCYQDVEIMKDALPDAVLELADLNHLRSRPQGFLLKTQPMLAAPYRVLDEAVIFDQRYRLLD